MLMMNDRDRSEAHDYFQKMIRDVEISMAEKAKEREQRRIAREKLYAPWVALSIWDRLLDAENFYLTGRVRRK